MVQDREIYCEMTKHDDFHMKCPVTHLLRNKINSSMNLKDQDIVWKAHVLVKPSGTI